MGGIGKMRTEKVINKRTFDKQGDANYLLIESVKNHKDSKYLLRVKKSLITNNTLIIISNKEYRYTDVNGYNEKREQLIKCYGV